MTNKELITFLEKLPPDCEIVLSKDAEGNRFSPLAEIEKANCTPLSSWEVEIVDEEDGKPCIIFWPVN